MDLFVRVVKNRGLAAAGREVGLSPASMSARMNGLEARYGTRLLNRTTRHVSPTDAGHEFFDACVRILASVSEAEAQLQTGRESFSGPLRVTAPSDVGQQFVAPVLSRFVGQHPAITPHLHLSDGIVNLAEGGFDIGIRYGLLTDGSLIARKLASSRRVLCASPAYLRQHGKPKTPRDLSNHECLVMVREVEPLTHWHFVKGDKAETVTIEPACSTNDGAVIRRWMLEDHGIGLKSYLDVANDISAGRLVTVLDDYMQDFEKRGAFGTADLHAVYPNRSHVPAHLRAFIELLGEKFGDFARAAA